MHVAFSPDNGIVATAGSDGVPPEQVDLENVTVEQFSVPRKYARPKARQGLQSIEAQTCRQRYVPGRARNVKVNCRIEGLSSEPVLLPVWIMAYRYRSRVYRFLLNGQTGKETGTAPFSYHKLAMKSDQPERKRVGTDRPPMRWSESSSRHMSA